MITASTWYLCYPNEMAAPSNIELTIPKINRKVHWRSTLLLLLLYNFVFKSHFKYTQELKPQGVKVPFFSFDYNPTQKWLTSHSGLTFTLFLPKQTRPTYFLLRHSWVMTYLLFSSFYVVRASTILLNYVKQYNQLPLCQIKLMVMLNKEWGMITRFEQSLARSLGYNNALIRCQGPHPP